MKTAKISFFALIGLALLSQSVVATQPANYDVAYAIFVADKEYKSFQHYQSTAYTYDSKILNPINLAVTFIKNTERKQATQNLTAKYQKIAAHGEYLKACLNTENKSELKYLQEVRALQSNQTNSELNKTITNVFSKDSGKNFLAKMEEIDENIKKLSNKFTDFSNTNFKNIRKFIAQFNPFDYFNQFFSVIGLTGRVKQGAIVTSWAGLTGWALKPYLEAWYKGKLVFSKELASAIDKGSMPSKRIIAATITGLTATWELYKLWLLPSKL